MGTTQRATSRKLADGVLVLDFTCISADMLALMGGKPAHLGVLAQAQLPAPPGFCVTAEAYRGVSSTAGLDDVLDKLAVIPAQECPALVRSGSPLLSSVWSRRTLPAYCAPPPR